MMAAATIASRSTDWATPAPRRRRLHAAVVAAALAACLLTAATGADPAPPPAVPATVLLGAQRVVVLGDSITHDGRWVAQLVAWMERRGTAAQVIDMGLPGETVSGLSEPGHANGTSVRPDLADRLDRVLRLTRPDVVLACYGMNCGIYQPLDAQREARFKEGMERLHATVGKAGATIIHLTPPVYSGPPGKPGPAGDVDYDAVLAAYSDWLVSKRADGWLVIDIHGPMKSMLAARRAREPGFAFSPDSVHPNDEGHWAICRAALEGLGDSAFATAESPAALAAFLPEVTERLHLLRDAALAASGPSRPELPPGLPLSEAEARAARITASIRSRRLYLAGHALPTGEWVAAIEWPRPRVVDPGPAPAAAAAAPGDAVVLFDGGDLSQWENAERWPVADGIVTVGKGNIHTRRPFGDCHLHVEFRTPTPPVGAGQGRSNSGVFLMGKYEIQVLDSYVDGTDGPLTYPDGQCGAIYKQRPPAVNASRRPGEWQTYDILFARPRFDAEGAVLTPGRVSVMHNGVAIHSDAVILGTTKWDGPPTYEPHADALPLVIQDHDNPVQFRSIWVRPFEPVAPGDISREPARPD